MTVDLGVDEILVEVPTLYVETVILPVQGPPGPRGPAGVVVIAANEETPPPGTPNGTVVYQRVT